jgi:hypothetical protein
MQGGVVSLAEAMPILFKGRRRHGWIAEAGMMLKIGRPIVSDVVLCRCNAVVVSLLGRGAEVWRRRRRLNVNHSVVRTARQQAGQWKQQGCENEKSFHD